MIQSRSIARELALLLLGQISEQDENSFSGSSFEIILQKVLDSLLQHWRERLDSCALQLENAQQHLLNSELHEVEKTSTLKVKNHLAASLSEAEIVLNSLSASLEFPRLLILSEQEEIKQEALKRVALVIEQRRMIDVRLDKVMEGWRLKRLPRIDRDILRLAVVDLTNLKTPTAVTCNEAVNLANRYSDEQGRRMINGVLRRLQNTPLAV